jgi:signal peptidase
VKEDIEPKIWHLKDSNGLIFASDMGMLHKLPSGKLGNVFFCAHIGPSMSPILRNLDLLEIVPYDNEPIRVGDVILFASPEGTSPVIHRVVGVTPEGIRTRGDSNDRDDPWIIGSADVAGRVVAAWRGQKKHRIIGGPAGRLAAHLIRWRCVLDRGMSQLLHPVYHSLARLGVVRRLLPNCFRPRVVVSQTGGHRHLRLLLGGRIVGQYDARRRQWHIQRPFRLFVDELALPQGQDTEANYYSDPMDIVG